MQLNETVLANNEFIQYLNAKKYVSRQRSKYSKTRLQRNDRDGDSTSLQIL